MHIAHNKSMLKYLKISIFAYLIVANKLRKIKLCCSFFSQNLPWFYNKGKKRWAHFLALLSCTILVILRVMYIPSTYIEKCCNFWWTYILIPYLSIGVNFTYIPKQKCIHFSWTLKEFSKKEIDIYVHQKWLHFST